MDYDLDLKNIYTLSNLSYVDSGDHVVGMDVDNERKRKLPLSHANL